MSWGGAFIDHKEYTDAAVESIRNGLWLKAAVERQAETDSVAGSAGRGSIERVLSQVGDSRYRCNAGIAVMTRDSRGRTIIGKDGGLFVSDGVPRAG